MNKGYKAVVTVIVKTYVENPDFPRRPKGFFSTAPVCKTQNFSTAVVERI